MEYQKKFNRQKVSITGIVALVVIGVSVLIGFLVGPGMVTDVNATPTLPPKETLAPLEGELVIEDTALINAIKNQLNIEGDITKEDMHRLEVLDYTDETVTNLLGLQHAINLREIRLKIDLTAESFEYIKGLNIEKITFVSDVSVQPLLEHIKEFKYLTHLDLTDCGISALGYLSELPMLETLILDNNRPANLEYVAGLKMLSTLSMRNCNLKDISVFENNKTLKYLHIEGNKIENFDVLETMALKEVTK